MVSFFLVHIGDIYLSEAEGFRAECGVTQDAAERGLAVVVVGLLHIGRFAAVDEESGGAKEPWPIPIRAIIGRPEYLAASRAGQFFRGGDLRYDLAQARLVGREPLETLRVRLGFGGFFGRFFGCSQHDGVFRFFVIGWLDRDGLYRAIPPGIALEVVIVFQRVGAEAIRRRVANDKVAAARPAILAPEGFAGRGGFAFSAIAPERDGAGADGRAAMQRAFRGHVDWPEIGRDGDGVVQRGLAADDGAGLVGFIGADRPAFLRRTPARAEGLELVSHRVGVAADVDGLVCLVVRPLASLFSVACHALILAVSSLIVNSGNEERRKIGIRPT